MSFLVNSLRLIPERFLIPGFIAGISVISLAAALISQYVYGMWPCVLCIYQRYPYGVAIGLGALAFAFFKNKPAYCTLVFLAAITFAVGSGIAFYHAGVEQHWWGGTADCGSIFDEQDGDITIAQMQELLAKAPKARCDEIPWSMFGISMAGYNVLASGGYALMLMFYLAMRLRILPDPVWGTKRNEDS